MWIRFVALFSFWCAALAFGIWQGGVTSWFIVFSAGVILAYVLLVLTLTLRSAEITIKLDQEQYVSEENITITFTVRQTSWIPLFWLVIEQSWHNGTKDKTWNFRQLYLPGFRRSITGKYMIKNVQRGEYKSQGMKLTTGDLFGLGTKRKMVKISRTLQVYPKSLPISPQFVHLLQGSASPLRSSNDTEFSGVRDYIVGDPLNRIHWKQAARTNILKTKELDSSIEKQVMVLLDACKVSYSVDEPIPLFEKCVEVTASLLQYAKDNQMTSGLICTNNQRSRLSEATTASLKQVYTLLSGVKADGDLAFHHAIRNVEDQFTAETTLLLVTPIIDDFLADRIRALRSKNIQIGILFVHNTVSLSWHQLYLKQLFQAMHCMFYSIEHTQLGEQTVGEIEYVG